MKITKEEVENVYIECGLQPPEDFDKYLEESRFPDFLDFTSEKIKMKVKEKLKKNFT